MTVKINLPGMDFLKGSVFDDCDKVEIIKSLHVAAEMKSDRLFVQVGIGDARSTVGLIMVLNYLKIDCNMLAIDSLPSAHFAWDSLCSGIRGSCKPHFETSFSKAITNKFAFYGPVWILVSGCHCYQCAKNNLKELAHRVVLDGFFLMNQANEEMEGSRISSPNHPDKVRCGVLRAVGSTSKIVDCYTPWHYTEDGSTKIWRRSR